MSKKKILIFYQYFLPGYKAGGPIQSLANMISLLGNEYAFSVVTSAFDLQSREPYQNIELNSWNEVNIDTQKVKVYYSSKRLSNQDIQDILSVIKPEKIYINGMYGWNFFLMPLLNKRNGVRYIISPRGMLQQGALQGKYLKKKIYLQALKWLGVTKKVCWHATNEEEKKDIQNIFGQSERVYIAANITKLPFAFVVSSKQLHQLKLIYLSLITEKKNLLLLIEILKECRAFISLDIYGPVKDEMYWQECKKVMQELPSNISIVYKGDVQPDNVQTTLQQYDAMILLTKGENFGHALFESLSVGRPIITSHFTPWNALAEKKAGWNVDINDQKSIVDLLDSLAGKTNEEWMQYCKEAHQLAANYFEEQHFKESYRKLFV